MTEIRNIVRERRNQVGRKHSDKTIQKMRDSHKKSWSLGRKKQVYSPEGLKRLSQSSKNNMNSWSHEKRMAAAKKTKEIRIASGDFKEITPKMEEQFIEDYKSMSLLTIGKLHSAPYSTIREILKRRGVKMRKSNRQISYERKMKEEALNTLNTLNDDEDII